MADIRVPTLGESVTEATVGKWFKQPGEAVAVDEPLVELETDKVTLEVPAPAAGVLSDIAVKKGDTVGVARCSARSRKALCAAPKAAAPAARAEPRTRQAGRGVRNAHSRGPPAASSMPMPPSVRKMAAESGMDPARSPAPACTGRSPKAT